jgi:hypothetical protein
VRRPLFLHVASTYWKHASITSPLDLPLVSISTFLEGVLASPNFGQVGGSSGSDSALSSFRSLDLLSRDLMFAFIHAEESFLFDPRAPYAASSTPHLHFAST